MRDPNRIALSEFLQTFRGMVVKPATTDGIHLRGEFAFSATSAGNGHITDKFDLEIQLPQDFPDALPLVTETGGRIPRHPNHHVNSDGTLCLGSPLRLMVKLSAKRTLLGFAEDCIIPYLFAISHKLRFGGPLPFDELKHGMPGVLEDYADLFGLKTTEQARQAWSLLGMKKRRANKYPCPCGCGKRLGQCRFNGKIKLFRKIVTRKWCRSFAI